MSSTKVRKSEAICEASYARFEGSRCNSRTTLGRFTGYTCNFEEKYGISANMAKLEGKIAKIP